MSNTQTHYSLRNVRPKLKTGLNPNLISMTVKRNFQFESKWPGQKFVPTQFITGEDLPEITGEAFLDDQFNHQLVTPNMSIENFDFNSPNDGEAASLLDSDFFVRFPPSTMTITLDQVALDEKLSKVPFTIRANVGNPGAYGGYPDLPEDDG